MKRTSRRFDKSSRNKSSPVIALVIRQLPVAGRTAAVRALIRHGDFQAVALLIFAQIRQCTYTAITQTKQTKHKHSTDGIAPVSSAVDTRVDDGHSDLTLPHEDDASPHLLLMKLLSADEKFNGVLTTDETVRRHFVQLIMSHVGELLHFVIGGSSITSSAPALNLTFSLYLWDLLLHTLTSPLLRRALLRQNNLTLLIMETFETAHRHSHKLMSAIRAPTVNDHRSDVLSAIVRRLVLTHLLLAGTSALWLNALTAHYYKSFARRTYFTKFLRVLQYHNALAETQSHGLYSDIQLTADDRQDFGRFVDRVVGNLRLAQHYGRHNHLPNVQTTSSKGKCAHVTYKLPLDNCPDCSPPATFQTINKNIYSDHLHTQYPPRPQLPCLCPVRCEYPTCINLSDDRECSETCNVGATCGNRSLQHGVLAHLLVMESKRTLLAIDVVFVGQMICEIIGECVPVNVFARSAYRMSRLSEQRAIMLDGEYILDASIRSNESRFLTHSCNPNAFINRRCVYGDTRLAVIALRTILAKEVITVDFALDHISTAQVPCSCRQATCRGVRSFIPAPTTVDKRRRSDDDNEARAEKRIRSSIVIASSATSAFMSAKEWRKCILRPAAATAKPLPFIVRAGFASGRRALMPIASALNSWPISVEMSRIVGNAMNTHFLAVSAWDVVTYKYADRTQQLDKFVHKFDEARTTAAAPENSVFLEQIFDSLQTNTTVPPPPPPLPPVLHPTVSSPNSNITARASLSLPLVQPTQPPFTPEHNTYQQANLYHQSLHAAAVASSFSHSERFTFAMNSSSPRQISYRPHGSQHTFDSALPSFEQQVRRNSP